MEKIESILNFWFEGITAPNQDFSSKNSKWFYATPRFNELIRSSFEQDINKAISGEYDSWLSSARGCLAMIILLDQFPRNLYPTSRERIKGDRKAITVAEHLISQGFETQLFPVHLIFVYLPFEHSEELKYQDLSVLKYRELLRNNQGVHRWSMAGNLRFAEIHRDVILKFGRFPGRNYYMGRPNTAEEEKYLREDQYGF